MSEVINETNSTGSPASYTSETIYTSRRMGLRGTLQVEISGGGAATVKVQGKLADAVSFMDVLSSDVTSSGITTNVPLTPLMRVTATGVSDGTTLKVYLES
tara:strand:+ start:384 stop:686 length:303 start_codon:yes stop_codon:yes gene_type:complete